MIGLIGGLFRAIYWRKPRNFAISNIIWMDWIFELREGKDLRWEDDIPHETFSSIFLLRHYPFSAALPSPPVCGVWAVRRANDGLWELILQQRDHVCSLMLEARKLEIGRNFRDKGGKLLKDKALLRFEDGEVFCTDSAALLHSPPWQTSNRNQVEL